MADRYAVATSNAVTWDSSTTTNWATSSGGAGGASAPTNADNVIFDSNSNAIGYTVTIGSGATCLDCTMNAPASGTITLAGSAAWTIKGSLVLLSGMTRTFTGDITFSATDSRTITFNGVTLATNHTTTFNGSGGTWTLQDAYSDGFITVSAGTLDTNGKTCSWTSFTNSSGTTLTLGASTVNIAQASGTAWNFNSGATLNAGTSTINLTNGQTGFAGGGKTYYAVSMNITNRQTFAGANSFTNLTITGTASTGALSYHEVQLSANQTVTGTFTVDGTASKLRVLISSSVLGTARTITAAALSLTDVDFSDITGAGAGTWSGTRVGNALGNSGITFTSAVTRYQVAAGNWSSTGSWSSSSGGSSGASVPLPQDTATFDASSNSGTTTVDLYRPCATLTCTGFTGTLAFSDRENSIFGAVTLASGMTISGTQVLTLQARSSVNITSAGKQFTQAVIQNGPSGTYTQQDDFSTASTFTITAGTWDAKSGGNYKLTCTVWSRSGTYTPRNGTLELTATQTFSDVTPAWYNFTVSGGTVTLGANQTFLGTVTVSGGTLTQNSKTITTVNYTNSGGTFTGSAAQVTVTGDFTHSSGTFTAPSTILAISGTVTCSGGTYTHNGVRLILNNTSAKNFTPHSAQSMGDVYLSNGCVLAHKYDEGSGTSATDYSGWGNTGTLTNGPTYSSTVPTVGYSDPYSIAFTSASSHYVSLASALGVSGASSRSFSAWIYPTSVSTPTKTIFKYGDEFASGALKDFGVHMGVISNGDIYVEFGGCDWYTATGAVTVNAWNHIIVTYNGSAVETSSNIGVYVNGVSKSLTSSGTSTGNAITTNNAPQIARDRNTASRYFPGNIDEPALVNRVYSSAERSDASAGKQQWRSLATTTLLGPLTCGTLHLVDGTLDARAYPVNATISYDGGIILPTVVPACSNRLQRTRQSRPIYAR